ncbi:hypothetical protein MPL3356_340025 [Mesorhizobium plurifarium]|uniref:Uncharacterized protein n=1 Tax=Mesorhizobium plurifarium TaxID=69974 RepID=A0A090FPF9_MESPL|nr:hypothetical protein MPL3356_340025 [Mesorhizobium plurifarium]
MLASFSAQVLLEADIQQRGMRPNAACRSSSACECRSTASKGHPTDVGAPWATYNTQKHFCEARLLRDRNVAAPHAYFDTDTVDCHHILFGDSQAVIDIPSSATCRKGVA